MAVGFFDSLFFSGQKFFSSVISYISLEHLLFRSSSFLQMVCHCFCWHCVGHKCSICIRICPIFNLHCSLWILASSASCLSSLSHWNELQEIIQWHVATEMYRVFPVCSISLIIYLYILHVLWKEQTKRCLWTGFPVSGQLTLFIHWAVQIDFQYQGPKWGWLADVNSGPQKQKLPRVILQLRRAMARPIQRETRRSLLPRDTKFTKWLLAVWQFQCFPISACRATPALWLAVCVTI